jgi:hypothetical protein
MDFASLEPGNDMLFGLAIHFTDSPETVHVCPLEEEQTIASNTLPTDSAADAARLEDVNTSIRTRKPGGEVDHDHSQEPDVHDITSPPQVRGNFANRRSHSSNVERICAMEPPNKSQIPLNR